MKKTTLIIACILIAIGLAGLLPYPTNFPRTVQTPNPGSGGNVTILKSFDGVSGPGYKDHPDPSGAVGPDALVDFTGSAFAVRNKTTGTMLEQETQTQFWKNAGISPGPINDPRIIYDPLSSRWFAVESAPYDLLAVSMDSDPTHAWKAVILTKIVSGDLLERVGVDANGVYVCSFGKNTPPFEAICFAIPIKDLLWSGKQSPLLSHMTTFPHLPFETFPAADFDPVKTAAAPEIFLTREGGQNGANSPLVLLMEKVTWSGETAHISSTQRIPTSLFYTTPGNAIQPGSSSPFIKGREDHRLLDLVVSNGNVYGAFGTEINHRVGADWFEVRISDGAVLQQSTIADPTYDMLFPTVAVDSKGDMAFGFTKTSATAYPSVYVAARTANDPLDRLETPVLAAGGTSAYSCPMGLGMTWLGHLLKLATNNPVGWGTYSTTVQDASNPEVLWTYQEFGNSSRPCQWGTHWSAFIIANR